MSLENQYIQRNQEETIPDTPKKTRKSSSKVENQTSTEKSSVIEKFSQRWDKKRASTIIGALLICLSFYCLLACVSYLFTWQIDQNRIIGKSFISFIFESNIQQVANWNGKLGAWISHTLIFNGFGIASFVIPFLIFLYGLKLLANIQFIPIQKTTSKSLVWMVWSSIFLGYFANYIHFVGGSFGYYINHWLRYTIGEIGTFVFILVLLYIVLVILHNPNFQEMFANLITHFTKEDTDEEESQEEEEYENKLRIKHTVTPDDLHIINPIKDEDIQNEFISKPVLFDEDDAFETVNPINVKQDIPSNIIQEIEEDFEALSQPIAPITAIENDDFIIEIPENTYSPITNEHPSISACFGKAFLPLHPAKYAKLLGEKLEGTDIKVWLINTGWTGGSYGVGSRMKLSYTRQMITAALEGKLNDVAFDTLPIFDLAIPTSCEGVPTEILNPRGTWADKNAYDDTANNLAGQFVKNFEQYASETSADILAAAPKVKQTV